MVNSLTSFADNNRQPYNTSLYGPLATGEVKPLKLPSLPDGVDTRLVIKCLRFIVTESRLPNEADFFQPNRLSNIASNSAKFCALATLVTGAVLVAGNLLTKLGLASNPFGPWAAIGAGLVLSTLRTRTISRRNSERRRSLRSSWGFSAQNKDADLSAFRKAVIEANHVFNGLSRSVAERHRWTFDPADPRNLDRAAGYVQEALFCDDDSLALDPNQPIDRGNIQRYRDSALKILNATEHQLDNRTYIGT